MTPWVDPQTLRPFALVPYLFAQIVIALPFVFLPASVFFSSSTVARSMMWTYVGVVVRRGRSLQP